MGRQHLTVGMYCSQVKTYSTRQNTHYKLVYLKCDYLLTELGCVLTE